MITDPLFQKSGEMELPVFFQRFIHQLSGESIYSDEGIPKEWEEQERLLMYRNPCYILRKKLDGALKTIEQIIENIFVCRRISYGALHWHRSVRSVQ